MCFKMASIGPAKEANKMAKKDVVDEFTLLKGVGESKAELLYDSGFNSLDKLKKASIEDLTKVKGISDKFAKDIKDQLKRETKPTSEKKQAKQEEAVEKKTTATKVKKEEIKEHKAKGKKPEDMAKDEEPEPVEEPSEEEEKYRVKKKPDLSKEQKEKLSIRKQIKKRTPKFLREEWFRYKKIPRNWRRPDGITSKMRINLKYRPSRVRVGFRGPRDVRGLHPSGFEEVAIYNVHDLENINPKTQAARIGSTVGTKKRIDIEKKAEELDIRILNM